MKALLFLSFLLLPISAHAAVIINEIAWMGSSPDLANDEWIELYNTGDSDVSLDGWKLTSDTTLEIPLTGTLKAGAYAVLERTDDDSAPPTAFVIYTGSLANTGGTLSLYRSDLSLEDRVAGGENWENIGGDNITKYTPQFTTSGWVTAKATPGGPVGVIEETDTGDEDTDESTEEGTGEEDVEEQDSTTSGIAIELKNSNSELSLAIHAPATVAIHQNVTFEAVSGGIGDTLIDSLVYAWNFGDIGTGTTKEVDHTFASAGEYVVTVEASFGRHIQIARKVIKVLPVNFSLSITSDGSVLVHNNAKYEVDVSEYVLQGQKRVVFPEHSIMLPNATVTIPKSKIGTGTHVVFRDAKQTVVATLGSSRQNMVILPALNLYQNYNAETVTKPTILSKQNFSFGENDQSSSTLKNETQPIQLASLQELVTETVETRAAAKSAKLPYIALCGVISVSIGLLFATKSRSL